jgi:16S rRNA (adenine1518-N6/adenine1519-N6)-dimethyltransferase
VSQTLTEIKQLLAAHGLSPKHRFGQNFLHDGNQMRRILDAAQVAPGELIVEVGPGTGALTDRLIQQGARVVAVEVDAELEPLLRERFDSAGDRFTLIVGDVLDGKHGLNAQLLAAVEGQRFKLIANLPYHIASPLLVNLATLEARQGVMTNAVVMVQKEVAERLAAGSGGKDYGPLGIVLQALYEVRTVGVLSPGCFWPAPMVSSAVVAMRRLNRARTVDIAGFSALVHKLFGQRRKQVGSILGRDLDWPAAPGIEPTQRPEQLSLEQLAALHDWLTDHAPKPTVIDRGLQG